MVSAPSWRCKKSKKPQTLRSVGASSFLKGNKGKMHQKNDLASDYLVFCINERTFAS